MSISSRTSTLAVNGVEYSISGHADLQQHLAVFPNDGHSELWLTLPDGSFISALINRDRALVIFGRHDGDPGLSSRSRDTSPDQAQELEFSLSNGQRDEYPLSWTIPIRDALAAFDYAFVHQEAAPWITWHDDA